MASLTLKSIPETLLAQLRSLAEKERRSLNQQTILLLEQALQAERPPFMDRYQAFVKEHGKSPLEAEDLDDLRSKEEGRPSPFDADQSQTAQ